MIALLVPPPQQHQQPPPPPLPPPPPPPPLSLKRGTRQRCIFLLLLLLLVVVVVVVVLLLLILLLLLWAAAIASRRNQSKWKLMLFGRLLARMITPLLGLVQVLLHLRAKSAGTTSLAGAGTAPAVTAFTRAPRLIAAFTRAPIVLGTEPSWTRSATTTSWASAPPATAVAAFTMHQRRRAPQPQLMTPTAPWTKPFGPCSSTQAALALWACTRRSTPARTSTTGAAPARKGGRA